ADWQEDLRVLYVACTRACDLLVLSAGLPDADGPLPATRWTLALEERFDPRTGRCLALDVTEPPKVRAVAMGPSDPDAGRTPPHTDRPAGQAYAARTRRVTH